MQNFDLLTTREVAILLNCYSEDATHFLKITGVEYIKCGKAYLWNKDEAMLAIQNIKNKRKEEKAGNNNLSKCN
jgi:hypothetical protein